VERRGKRDPREKEWKLIVQSGHFQPKGMEKTLGHENGWETRWARLLGCMDEERKGK